jgi:TRAP-type C4-dicarboxylate transport system permease small subunit
MKRLGHIIEILANIGGNVAGWLVPLMMLLVVFEAFMRYILNRPPLIADEFAGYMLVAVSYLGMAFTWKQKGHIRITFLVSKLPFSISSPLRLVTLVIAFIFSLVLTRSSYVFMVSSFKFHLSSSTWAHFPLQGPQMTLTIGFVFLSLLLALEITKAIINIRSGRRLEE